MCVWIGRNCFYDCLSFGYIQCKKRAYIYLENSYLWCIGMYVVSCLYKLEISCFFHVMTLTMEGDLSSSILEILVLCWLSMNCKEKEISDSGWWMHMKIHLNEISALFILGPSKWTSTRNSCYVLIVNEMRRERNFWLWLMNAYQNTFKWDISCIPLRTIKINKY